MSWFTKVIGAITGGGQGGVVGKALDLASEKLQDPDKLAALIADITKAQIMADKAPGWLQALQNIQELPKSLRYALAAYIWADAAKNWGRILLWGLVVGAYIYVSISTGQKMAIEDLMALAAGPGLYTLLKGRGR